MRVTPERGAAGGLNVVSQSAAAIARVDRQRLRRALGKLRGRADRPEGRIVVVHGARGGTGTSTLAANLAAALLAHGGPVALADLALWSADQELLWNASPVLRLTDVVGPEGHDLADALVAHRSGVRLLAGPGGPDDAAGIPAGAVGGLLRALGERHPSVVVDTATGFDEVTIEALLAATVVLVPVMPDLTALRALQRALVVWDRLGVPLERIRVALWDRPSAVDAGMVRRVTGQAVAYRLAWLPREVLASANAGEPLLFGAPRGPLARSLAPVVAALVPGRRVAGEGLLERILNKMRAGASR